MPKTMTAAKWLIRLGVWAGPVVLSSQNIKTGPQLGQQIPGFAAEDQDGRTETLKSIMGPKGAMLVFFRSADW
jgi:hypothetical protein